MARMAGVNFRDFAVQRFHRSLRTQKQSCRTFKGPSNCINKINLINSIWPLFGFLCSCEFHFLNEFNWNFGNKLNQVVWWREMSLEHVHIEWSDPFDCGTSQGWRILLKNWPSSFGAVSNKNASQLHFDVWSIRQAAWTSTWSITWFIYKYLCWPQLCVPNSSRARNDRVATLALIYG